jgi:VanZ family protein
MGVIYALSAEPYSSKVTQVYLGSWNVFVRKLGHISEFAVLFWLLYGAFFCIRSKIYRYHGLTAYLIAVFYSLLDEWHQSFVPGRSSQLSDVLVDTIGIVTAWIMTYYACNKIRGVDISSKTADPFDSV